MKNQILVLLACSMLGGCVTSGVIGGVSEGQQVQFDYEQAFFDNDGVLRITMPDGEQYSGKFVQLSSSTSGDDWEIGESSDDDSWVIKDRETVSSLAEAMLIGDRGHTMKCRFQFSNPDFGIEGGGIGECETSAANKVSVTF